MNLKNWFNRQLAAIAFATANVEKSALGQQSEDVDAGVGTVQNVNKGTLMDALTRGEITQEVIDLRWRTFKVLNATDGLVVSENGLDENGDVIYSVSKAHKPSMLRKVKLDEHDDYPLSFVVFNDDITLGGQDVTDVRNFKIKDKTEVKESVKTTTQEGQDDMITAVLGNISNEDYHASIKTIKPIVINREFRPKFEIEKYSKKMNIRKINDSEYLLEFYISIYPDEYDRKTRLLLSEIKRAIANPRATDLLDITDVGFVGYKTPGAKDFHQYQYKITGFDKIVTFDGHYVIKFKSEVTVNGEYLLEKYRSETLDERYKNKQRKKS